MQKELVVWIFQAGEPLPIDDRNLRPMRAMNLASKLVERGHKVVLWSSTFDHQSKTHRFFNHETVRVNDSLEVRLIHSRGYRKNLGLARLIDHAQLAFQLRRILSCEIESPDIAFVGYPPIEPAYVFVRGMKTRGVPVLLDVKDQWPVIFIDALPKYARPLGQLLFLPYFYLARMAMKTASGISAMSDGFLQWALDFCGRPRGLCDAVFPLTTPIGEMSDDELLAAGGWWDSIGVENKQASLIYFVGSFSRAFDFMPVKKAAQMAMKNQDNLQFVLCGEGGNVDEVRTMMDGLTNVVFPGWVDRSKLEVLASRCIASIAPYRNTPDFMLSIPNKVVDSLALGLPVLTSLEGEVSALINANQTGIKYDDRDYVETHSLYRAIKTLVDNPDLQKSMSHNASELYSTRFSFERVYGKLALHLERMAEQPLEVLSDKDLERERYEQRARKALAEEQDSQAVVTVEGLSAVLRAPYEKYVADINASITDAGMKVLEIGAGTGMCTEVILQTGARVVATDISKSALALLARRTARFSNLETRVADMESLPFADAEFDVVCSAGSLSYGENRIVMQEIYRVLKPGGRFICVDSLNHNPIYRLNRWIQYRRGQRTRSTIERMPTLQMIQSYREKFGRVGTHYFGSVIWLTPLLSVFMPDRSVGEFCSKIDSSLGISKSAFKFVMVAEKSSL